MAKLYISEFGGFGANGSQVAMISTAMQDLDRSITLTTSPAWSTTPIDAATSVVRLHADAICSFAIVASTTEGAAITHKRMAADQTEYFSLPFGKYISAISNS